MLPLNFRLIIMITFAFKFFLVFGQSPTIHFAKDEIRLRLNSECETTVHTLGTCKRVHDCPPERVKLNTKDICYFEQKYPVVCCERDISGFPILAPAKKPSTTKTPIVGSIRKSSSPSIQGQNQQVPQNQTGMSENLMELSSGLITTTTSTLTSTVTATETSSNIVDSQPLLDSTSLFYRQDIYSSRVKTSNRTSNKECIKYPSLGVQNKTKTFGRQLFVGGVLLRTGESPQIAAIGWKSFGGVIDWKCGGSLISLNFVLTAAHCTFDRGQPAEIIRVGDLNLLKENDTMSQDFNVTKIFNHPNYKKGILYHDIALIKITPNAVFNFFIKPACIWTEPDVPIMELVAMGYGTDSFAGRKTNELYGGNLTLVPNEECRKALGTNVQIPNGIIDSQLCAKDPKGIADTCQGDSGGPLLFTVDTLEFFSWHIVGITSFGESCAGPTPGVYTRVSSYIDWIESIVWQNEN